MFSGCSSLSSLPDISKWNTKDDANINFIFGNCISLLNLIDFLDFYIGDGFEIEAIECVMHEGKLSRKEAVKALLESNGDPVEALLNFGK